MQLHKSYRIRVSDFYVFMITEFCKNLKMIANFNKEGRYAAEANTKVGQQHSRNYVHKDRT
jgi:hypothetical protein